MHLISISGLLSRPGKTLRALIPAALFCFALASSAHAETTYLVSGVTFPNGSVASGSFTFDGTSVFSNINISLTAGANAPFNVPFTFSFEPSFSFNGPSGVRFVTQSGNLTGSPGIFFVFDPTLNDPLPGMDLSLIVTCDDPNCFGISNRIDATAGSVEAVPVPEPGAVVLVSLGLAALGLRKMRNRA